MTLIRRRRIIWCLRKCCIRSRTASGQIVMLHALSGLKHREVADLLGIPQATAISRYNRALAKLRTSMGGDDLDR